MFDVIVIGGGHAGTEAAAAACRRGAFTCLLTFDRTGIGAMSCNPSIGGVGKGHIVREVDALDGLMARAADAGAIHHRMLNASKGRAVQGPRVQADRYRYAAAVQRLLATMPGLTIVEGEAVDLMLDGGRVAGVRLADGSALAARAVVLATGTFLSARMFRGDERMEGGRISERAANRLGERLRERSMGVGRLKTGTPPRLDGRTIDWARLAEQPSDADGWTMSPLSGGRTLPQVACAVTRTGEATHAIIRAASATSPLSSGAIEGVGPRYCPSVEDKVRRFGDRDGHQLFLEPEGLDDPMVYPNGLSTSLDVAAQAAMVASIAGLERARVTSWGYAVEYDYLDPRGLDHRLAVRTMPGLFAAGQINGTTGYEEAAGQGLVAGANAAALARDLTPLLLDRASSYLGVMIDDLVLQGVSEPYRMLTARAEYRLSLRADNAEARLTGAGRDAGLIGPERLAHLDRRAGRLAAIDAALDGQVTAAELRARGAVVAQDGARRPIRAWLGAGVALDHAAPALADDADPLLAERVEDARYAPYLTRQAAEIERLRREEALSLTSVEDFLRVPGLSNEMAERLQAVRPPSLAAASRVNGVTPAALVALLLHARAAA